MKTQKIILGSVTLLLSVIPGFLILKKSLGVPVEYFEQLCFGVVEAAGCLAILIIYNQRQKIGLWTSRNITRITLFTFTMFLIGLITYIFLFSYCIIDTPPPSGKGFLPLISTTELDNEIANAGGKFEFVKKWQTDGVMTIVQKTASFQLTLTLVIFLLLYVITLVYLVTSFALITINMKKE